MSSAMKSTLDLCEVGRRSVGGGLAGDDVGLVVSEEEGGEILEGLAWWRLWELGGDSKHSSA